MVDSRELTAADSTELCELYASYGWWDDRSPAHLRRALERTDLAIGLEEDDELLAAARVLTDFTYYATVYDVIVAESRRHTGLGTQLLQTVVDRLEDTPLNGLTLYCRAGLEPFYASIGFDRATDEVAVPEGGSEPLRTMYYSYEHEK